MDLLGFAADNILGFIVGFIVGLTSGFTLSKMIPTFYEELLGFAISILSLAVIV